MKRPPLKVLVVEDSAVVREFLVHILHSDPGIRVIGTARNGEQALNFLKRERPDVVTMDIHMPVMDGLEATRRIMETEPIPVVIVSGSSNPGEVETTFRAVEAGAVAVLPRPRGLAHEDHAATAAELVRTVKLMAEVKLVRRWPKKSGDTRPPLPLNGAETRRRTAIEVVAIGASTGGPTVLQTILSKLPKDFPVPVLIVQHIAAGFVRGLAEWLSQSTGFPVHVAMQGETLLPGHAYVAPEDYHLGVGARGRAMLTRTEPEHGMRPAVSCLFRSVASVYGPNVAGVLLTGMGKDGAGELRLMREAGALTMAQDRESSVVHGMPGEAKALDAVSYTLTPSGIAEVLATAASASHPRTTTLS